MPDKQGQAMGRIEPVKVTADQAAPGEQPQPDSKGALQKQPEEGPPLKKRKWGQDEREFLPAALEIMETPANPLGRAIALSLGAFFTIAVLWAMIGEVDVVAVATGRLVPVGGVKTIQPLEAGTVRAIHVRDGQHVSSGARLIELDPTESEVDKGQMQREMMAAQLEIARLGALLRGLSGEAPAFVPPEGIDPIMSSTALQQLQSDLSAYQAQFASLRAELARRQADFAAIEAEVRKLETTLPLIEDREESLHNLYRKGIAPKPNWLEVKTLLIETRSNVKIQRHRMEEARAGMVSARKEQERLLSETRKEALGKMVEARNQMEGAVLALRKANKRESQNLLLAPVSGVVQQLAVHTVGGVVSPAEPLMVIVPDDAPLEVQAQVLNKDIGFVSAEQRAEIKVDSFPFTKYGTIDGEVKHLSRDAIQDEELGLVYDSRVTMDRSSIFANGRDVELSSGMSVTVEIKTGKRKIIEFLLSPLMRYQAEAIRER